jgi:hypothetical protein
LLSIIAKVSNLVIALGFVVLMSDCAAADLMPAQEILDNRSDYLNKAFSPQQLSQIVSKNVPHDEASPKFDRLKILTELSITDSAGKKTLAKETIDYVNVGEGLLQEVGEGETGLVYRLTYKGLVYLKQQKVMFNSRYADQLFEITKAERFDAIPSTVGKEFVYDYTFGFVRDGATYHWAPIQITCNTTRTFLASEIHKKLSGQALEFACQTVSGTKVMMRQKWALLQSYGLALILEETVQNINDVRRVVDVN